MYHHSMDLRKWSVFTLIDNKILNKIKFACVFGDTGNEVLYVTEDDELWGFGPNTHGCLALANQPGCLEPKPVQHFKDKRIKGFAFGSGPHTVVVTEKGETYSWGHNGYCELGRGATTQVLIPGLIAGSIAEVKIVEVACGKYHTLALSDSGEIFAWGQNHFGQVGSGVTSNQSNPKKVNAGLYGKFVTKVACGHASSLAVLANGEVYGWGYNGSGQLGIGNNSNQLTPVRLNGLSGVVISNLVCGFSHTLALSDSGILYGWGLNGFGQLGTGDKGNLSSPTKICGNIGRVIDIAATHYSQISAAMTENFKVYMWGQCRGQSVTEPILTPYNSLHEVFAHFSDPAVSYKPILSKTNHEDVGVTLGKSFDDPMCSDLTIMVEQKPIRVHKAILKLRCGYFRSMFQEPWQENNQNILTIDTKTYSVYKAFLQYLYTDKIDLPPEDALELLDLAAEYCEESLKKSCEEIIKHGITVDNAALLYANAIAMEAEELEEFCLSYALNHMTAVIQSAEFSKLNETVMKNFILEASKRGAFKS